MREGDFSRRFEFCESFVCGGTMTPYCLKYLFCLQPLPPEQFHDVIVVKRLLEFPGLLVSRFV